MIKKQPPLILCLLLGILSCSTPSETQYNLFKKNVESGQLSVQILATETDRLLNLALTNNTQKAIDIIIPAGLVFYAESSDVSSMMTIFESHLTVKPQETLTLMIAALSIEFSKKNPEVIDNFEVHRFNLNKNKKLTKLLSWLNTQDEQTKNTFKADTSYLQYAVWFITDSLTQEKRVEAGVDSLLLLSEILYKQDVDATLAFFTQPEVTAFSAENGEAVFLETLQKIGQNKKDLNVRLKRALGYTRYTTNFETLKNQAFSDLDAERREVESILQQAKIKGKY